MVDDGVYMSTLLLKIKWQSRSWSCFKLVKISRPYFQCVHHHLVPGKRHQRHGHNSKFNSWYSQLVYAPATGMVSVFVGIFWFCTRDTLLQETDKNTTPASNPLRTTTNYSFMLSWSCLLCSGKVGLAYIWHRTPTQKKNWTVVNFGINISRTKRHLLQSTNQPTVSLNCPSQFHQNALVNQATVSSNRASRFIAHHLCAFLM